MEDRPVKWQVVDTLSNTVVKEFKRHDHAMEYCSVLEPLITDSITGWRFILNPVRPCED